MRGKRWRCRCESGSAGGHEYRSSTRTKNGNVDSSQGTFDGHDDFSSI